jgi:ubiquinone/menaquinone biosynthesis C-methylase UbiE
VTAPESAHDVAALYTRAAADYGRVGAPLFGHAGRRLVELANVRAGQRVLDVAAGRGAVLFPAAERAGRDGYMLGIDISNGMVEHTTADIQARGLTQAEMRLMDAEALDLPKGSFDVVLCSFAVFFFNDLARALRRMREVLVPGGTIGFAFARGTDPRWEWYEALLGRYGVLERLPPRPGEPGIREPQALVEALISAGFNAVREIEEATELAFRDAEDWWASLWTHGSRLALEMVATSELERFRTECLQRVREQQTPAGLPINYRLVYVLARG